MIKNDQKEVLSFGSSMGCYLILEQVYLEVVCGIVRLSKKEKIISKYELLSYL